MRFTFLLHAFCLLSALLIFRYGKTLPDHSRMLKYKRVTALIPGHNINAYTPDEFTLNVVEDLYYTPVLTERTTMHASQVIMSFLMFKYEL